MDTLTFPLFNFLLVTGIPYLLRLTGAAAGRAAALAVPGLALFTFLLTTGLANMCGFPLGPCIGISFPPLTSVSVTRYAPGYAFPGGPFVAKMLTRGAISTRGKRVCPAGGSPGVAPPLVPGRAWVDIMDVVRTATPNPTAKLPGQ